MKKNLALALFGIVFHAQAQVVEAPPRETPIVKAIEQDSTISISAQGDYNDVAAIAPDNSITPLKSSSNYRYKFTTVTQELRLSNFRESIVKVNEYFAKEKIEVNSQNQNNNSFNATFVLNKEQFAKWNSFILGFGYLSVNNINVNDNTENVDNATDNLVQAERRLKEVNDRLAHMKTSDDGYQNAINEMNNWESSLQSYRRNLRNLQSNNNLINVTLTIIDEMYTPQNTRVSFVNMPGLEYSYLKVDEPLDTVTNSAYQGVMLKYVFTRGKSFANLGAYKTTAPASPDRKHFSEMFIFGFGQDFYTRHFGHGNNRFLNMYTTYTIGGLLASNESRKLFSPYVAPGVGVELFKNKYVLIDTKASYFVPFKDVRHMRGLSLSASFNFVF